MFLALFHTKAGKFTIEEFNVATEEFKRHASPKVYTYCKDLQAGEQESPELAEFKRKLFEEMGHYWSRYNNRDSMQLHFVMQLQLVETSGMVEKLKLEDGTVMLEGMPIAMIDNLQFAAGNEAYQKLSVELATLPKKIEKARQRVDKFPNDEDLRDDLRKLLLLAPDDTAKNYVEVQLRTIESKIKFMCNIKSATYWIKNRFADVQDMLDEISYTDLVSKDNSKDKPKIKAKVKDLLPIKDIITVTVYLPCGEKMKFALLGKPLEDEVSDGLTAPALEVNDKVRWNGVKLYAPVYLLKWNKGDRIDSPTEIIPSGETWLYGDLGWRGEK
jgi:hypothetical protein